MKNKITLNLVATEDTNYSHCALNLKRKISVNLQQIVIEPTLKAFFSVKIHCFLFLTLRRKHIQSTNIFK